MRLRFASTPPGTYSRPATFCPQRFSCRERVVRTASGGPASGRDQGILIMSLLISLLITILVIGLVLYLVRMLPLDAQIKNIIQIIVIIIGIISLLRYLNVFTI